jgi:lactoylglutathione lyase
MAKITGIGGVFLKTSDKSATAKWFTDNLDLPEYKWGWKFPWRDAEDPKKKGSTVLSLFPQDSDYFDPSKHHFMVNLRVDDMDGMLELLRGRGVEVIKVFEPDAFGRFAHIAGPDGMKIELWEPPKAEDEDTSDA